MLVDENAIVLDYLSHGKSTGFRQKPLAQVIGVDFFTLLEVVPKPNVVLIAGARVYIGKGQRNEIDFIKQRIRFKDLTSNAVAELDKVIEGLVKEQEKRFVDFFNNAKPITIRRHQLELLPGLGKKHLLGILAEREKMLFSSFKDIEQRVPLMSNVVRIILKRILEEIEGNDEKHFLFAKPFVRQEMPFRQK